MSTRVTERHGQGEPDSTQGHTGKLVVAWAVVGIPLAYGVASVLIRAAQLFTG